MKTRSIFLGLSKASDRVLHDGLLYELERNGISRNLLDLLRSFLLNWKQRVVLNGKCSNWECVGSGVLQGSILSPLFLLVYIHDLADNINCYIKLFGYDTITIFSSSR